MLRALSNSSKQFRGKWGHMLHFLASLTAATLGLTDVFLFPWYVVHFRGAFFFAFLITILVIGTPLVAIEMYLGQFTSAGPTTCWELCPILRGVGFGSVTGSALLMIPYVVGTAYSLSYFVSSFSSELPWAACDRKWATDRCFDFLKAVNATQCKRVGWVVADDGACYHVCKKTLKAVWNVTLAAENNITRNITNGSDLCDDTLNVTTSTHCQDMGWLLDRDGACYDVSADNKTLKALWNKTLASSHGIHQELPAIEYLEYYLLGFKKDGIDFYHLGQVHWDLFAFVVITWVLACFTLQWGLKCIGTLSFYVLTTVIIIMIFVLVSALFQEGAADGFYSIFAVEMNDFTMRMWAAALQYVWFTLGLNSGKLICVASFSDFQDNITLYAFLVIVVKIVVSIFSGGIIFAVLGSISKRVGVLIEELHLHSDFTYAAYAYAISHIRGANVISVGLFFTLFLLGFSFIVISVETIVSSMTDLSDFLQKHKKALLVFTAAVYICFQLPLVTDGGFRIVELIFHASYSIHVFIVAFFQSVAVGWLYGAGKFMKDVRFMVDLRARPSCLRWKLVALYFEFSWAVLVPLITVVVPVYHTFVIEIPDHIIPLVLQAVCIVPLPVCAAHAVYKRKGPWRRRLTQALHPSAAWGPTLVPDKNLWLSLHDDIPAGPSSSSFYQESFSKPTDKRLKKQSSPRRSARDEKREIMVTHSAILNVFSNTCLGAITEVSGESMRGAGSRNLLPDTPTHHLSVPGLPLTIPGRGAETSPGKRSQSSPDVTSGSTAVQFNPEIVHSGTGKSPDTVPGTDLETNPEADPESISSIVLQTRPNTVPGTGLETNPEEGPESIPSIVLETRPNTVPETDKVRNPETDPESVSVSSLVLEPRTDTVPENTPQNLPTDTGKGNTRRKEGGGKQGHRSK